MQSLYSDYIYIIPSKILAKVHREDGSDWRRPATEEETNMWRLKKMPPFEFKFI